MTLGEIKERCMFQTNNDADDLGDYEPHIEGYVNDAYDRIVNVWAKQHVIPGNEDYPPLEEETDVPKVPEWTHHYLADWATWLIYRNGNPQKQQRGYAFRDAFLSMLATVSDEGGASGLNADGSRNQYKYFINIPK